MEYSLNTTGLIDSCTIDLMPLYAEQELVSFSARMTEYLALDEYAAQITRYKDGILTYKSESFVPIIQDSSKPNLMLILGNPAPESIALGALFAYENNGKRYHRFWNVLEQTGIIMFDRPANTIPPHDKMQKLYAGDFASPFNVFIFPFYSFATPPGGRWSGVAGVKRIFGKAYKTLEQFELQRVQDMFNTYLSSEDTVLVFQKDAYLSLARNQLEQYDYKTLLKEPLVTSYNIDLESSFTLACMLPTRLFHAQQTKAVLSALAKQGSLI